MATLKSGDGLRCMSFTLRWSPSSIHATPNSGFGSVARMLINPTESHCAVRLSPLERSSMTSGRLKSVEDQPHMRRVATMTDTSPDRMDFLLNLLDERPSEDWEWRFEPAVGGWSAVNAVALRNLSLLAYSDWADVQRFLGKWHFSDSLSSSNGETQGFAARRDDAVFVSFRGTEPLRLAQWVEDIRYSPSSLLPTLPGLVHGGFASLFDNVKDSMWDAVNALIGDQATRLFVTGHSLGGALAVLAAAEMEFDSKLPAIRTRICLGE
jgi:Lipase (class 3)